MELVSCKELLLGRYIRSKLELNEGRVDT